MYDTCECFFFFFFFISIEVAPKAQLVTMLSVDLTHVNLGTLSSQN